MSEFNAIAEVAKSQLPFRKKGEPGDKAEEKASPKQLFTNVLGQGPDASNVNEGNAIVNEAGLLRLGKRWQKFGLGHRDLVSETPQPEIAFVVFQDDVPVERKLKAAQRLSDEFLRANNYKEAIGPLNEELEILRKSDPKEEGQAFIKPYARLAMCLRETSNGKGDKKADENFTKVLELIKKNPEGDKEKQREQDVYRALVLEGKGLNDRLLGLSATDGKGREARYKKTEEELTEALKVLNARDFKDNPYRLRALVNLAIVEDALGHKEKSKEHMEELKKHPLYPKMRSMIETTLAEEQIAKVKDKSPALKQTIEELEKCPWGKLVSPIVAPDLAYAQYDNKNSKIVLGGKISEAELPQKYAFAATMAYKQQLFKLYSGDKPVSEETYTAIQLENMVAAHRAEIKVAADLEQPVVFVAEDGKKHDLSKMSDKEIGDLLREQRLLQKFWKDSYAEYANKDAFTANKENLTKAKMLIPGY